VCFKGRNFWGELCCRFVLTYIVVDLDVVDVVVAFCCCYVLVAFVVVVVIVEQVVVAGEFFKGLNWSFQVYCCCCLCVCCQCSSCCGLCCCCCCCFLLLLLLLLFMLNRLWLPLSFPKVCIGHFNFAVVVIIVLSVLIQLWFVLLKFIFWAKKNNFSECYYSSCCLK
jgi:hypothetical protein